MEAKLYHIKLKGSDGLSEGYIGVTTRSLEERFQEHLNSDTVVGKAIRKYKDRIELIELKEGEEDYIYSEEERLRPEDKIGWNLVKGGGNPPKTTSKSSSKGHETKRLNGYYEYENIKKIVDKTISTLRDSGYYQSDAFLKYQGIRAFSREINKKEKGYYQSDIFKEKRLRGKFTKRSRHPSFNKPIDQYNLDGELIKSWNSVYEASDELKLKAANIDQCCKGNKITAYKFKWKYRTFND